MTSAKRVIVIGSGPGGIAAATRLRDRAKGQLEVLLIERESASEFLPGTLATVLGQTTSGAWRQPLSLRGITVRLGEVIRANGRQVELASGEQILAEAVIAAPGLALDLESVPPHDNLFAFWSPSTAAAVGQVAANQTGGTVVVAISSLPYRCPPAPFSLAMQLATHYQDQYRPVRVVITTPEAAPLEAIGGEIPDFLSRVCAEAGVELQTGVMPDWANSAEGRLTFTNGETLAYDLALVIPPHVRSPLLRHLPGQGAMTPVRDKFESTSDNLFVIGDAAMTRLPRAAGAAVAQGWTAADAILARLGLASDEGPPLPEPECYIGHGRGIFSRIRIRFPDGLPPAGKPEIILDQPSADLAAGFAQAFTDWRVLRREGVDLQHA